ncbi:SEC-C metal-binding domain-containing protein [Escherichia coli]|uniref:SEC-C metal-binding domain-containing protein n=1 Tax=Escherichia coli TaxID=562 RepID=UPI00300D51D2
MESERVHVHPSPRAGSPESQKWPAWGHTVHRQAAPLIARLAPFFEGLTGEQRLEVENQSNYIAQLAYKAAKSEVTRLFGAVGRNEPCPCRSGVKYKKCHGA